MAEQVHKGFTREQLAQAFELAQAGACWMKTYQHCPWKSPFGVILKKEQVDVTVAAIEFYDADTPSVNDLGMGDFLVETRGYQAW